MGFSLKLTQINYFIWIFFWFFFFFLLIKLYLAHFLFVWINLFVGCLQIGWSIIFIFVFIGLIFIFLPYYIVSTVFVFNYLAWHANSIGKLGNHLYNMESELGISRVHKYGVRFQFSPDFLQEEIDQFVFLSGYFVTNPDNYLRIVYYFVTSIFFVSFLFVFLVFLGLAFFYTGCD